jgi:site-specific DNA-methyltransferase (adenine-specific)
MTVRIIQGDCRATLKTLADESLQCCVTDPPYELGFMGKAWDSSGIAYDGAVWREVWRVLKPGAFLLAFGGTRTYHRLACAIEDAGFEIRDQIGWAYGSGFPKSLDVSKALDKAAGVEMESRGHIGFTISDNGKTEGAFRTNEERANPGCRKTAPATDAARQWQGWGTALKPAWEPIVVARKPLIGTVVENVLKHGCGALNVDGCRVGTNDTYLYPNGPGGKSHHYSSEKRSEEVRPNPTQSNPLGRWPANLVHDGSAEVLACFPSVASGAPCGVKAGGKLNCYGEFAGGIPVTGFGDEGSAARFFYCAKACAADRNEGLGERNKHPTVKPVALMRWLVRLVCPPQGTVLDPFAGSGSTGKAAEVEGFNSILIEKDAGHVKLIEKRTAQRGLFCGAAS